MLCSNAEGASLKGCNFEDPSGLKANLEGSLLSSLIKRATVPHSSTRTKQTFLSSGANLKGVDMEGSQMTGINLRVATLKNAKLKNCNLRGATLAGTDLEVGQSWKEGLSLKHSRWLSWLSQKEWNGASLTESRCCHFVGMLQKWTGLLKSTNSTTMMSETLEVGRN